MAEAGLQVGIDATPLQTGHGVRGIGRYLDGLLQALGASEPRWLSDTVGVLLTGQQLSPEGAPWAWRTVRSSWRPQDFNPILAVVADRLAIRGHRPRLWHHTDPVIPSSPLSHRRTIVTVYDLIPLQVPAVMAAIRPHRRLAYRRYLDLIRSARGVIAISETTRETITSLLGVERTRIHVVPPSVGVPWPASNETPPGDPPSPRAPYVFVGVPDPHKRPELAIDAIAELVRRGQDPELTMVGLHPLAIRDRLIERARSAGIADRVAFVDRVDDAALVALYRRATTLALSSVEGFGLPPVEAVLAGGRVVATPTAAYLETLDGYATFAGAETPSAIADAAERSADAHGVRDATGLADRYSPDAAALALQRAYEALDAR